MGGCSNLLYNSISQYFPPVKDFPYRVDHVGKNNTRIMSFQLALVLGEKVSQGANKRGDLTSDRTILETVESLLDPLTATTALVEKSILIVPQLT